MINGSHGYGGLHGLSVLLEIEASWPYSIVAHPFTLPASMIGVIASR
ncbi:MAG: hypothetical protein K0S58_2231 [Nitrospira sp.]|jgi:hypothetical protein|nr:hypothetical protein [Nitrospira sp.]